MEWVALSLAAVISFATAVAGEVRVTVGDTGCRARQIAVEKCWRTLDGVESVTILRRRSGDPAAQRVFVITCRGETPDQETLTKALGRRSDQYPILKIEKPADNS